MSSTKRVTKRDIRSAAASYQNMLTAYGEHNMATHRAEWEYRELERRYALQKSEREFVKAFSENKWGELM